MKSKCKELFFTKRYGYKKYSALMMAGVLFVTFCISFTGCEKEKEKEKIELLVWTSSEEVDCVQEAVDAFANEYSDQYDLQIKVQAQDVSSAKKLVVNNKDIAADVYNFADDQFFDLQNAKALLPIGSDADKIADACGGKDSKIIQSVSEGNDIYGYPFTSGNGYFLYYNNSYFSEDDVLRLEDILEIAADNNKKFGMDLCSGWYMYSFFGAAGMSVHTNEDGTKNVCDFNRTEGKYTGVDVTEKIIEIATHDGFQNIVKDRTEEMIKSGDVIAIVSGSWYHDLICNAWGKENVSASKLPTYNLNGDDVQMSSFSGYRYYGVNSSTKYPEIAKALCEYITSKEQQEIRFDKIEEAPANVELLNSEKVSEFPTVQALVEQNQYAIVQNVLESYWRPMEVFGAYIASGNKDNIDLQELLDITVVAITQ